MIWSVRSEIFLCGCFTVIHSGSVSLGTWTTQCWRHKPKQDGLMETLQFNAHTLTHAQTNAHTHSRFLPRLVREICQILLRSHLQSTRRNRCDESDSDSRRPPPSSPSPPLLHLLLLFLTSSHTSSLSILCSLATLPPLPSSPCSSFLTLSSTFLSPHPSFFSPP